MRLINFEFKEGRSRAREIRMRMHWDSDMDYHHLLGFRGGVTIEIVADAAELLTFDAAPLD